MKKKKISWNSSNCCHRWWWRACVQCMEWLRRERHDHKIPRCWTPNSHIIIPKWVMRFVRCAPRTWLKYIFRAVFYLSLARISFPSTARAHGTAQPHTHAIIRSPFCYSCTYRSWAESVSGDLARKHNNSSFCDCIALSRTQTKGMRWPQNFVA